MLGDKAWESGFQSCTLLWFKAPGFVNLQPTTLLAPSALGILTRFRRLRVQGLECRVYGFGIVVEPPADYQRYCFCFRSKWIIVSFPVAGSPERLNLALER